MNFNRYETIEKIMMTPGLTTAEYRISYYLIMIRGNAQSGLCCVTDARIARDLALTKRTVERAKAALRAHRLVDWTTNLKNKRNSPCVYSFPLPTPASVFTSSPAHTPVKTNKNNGNSQQNNTHTLPTPASVNPKTPLPTPASVTLPTPVSQDYRRPRRSNTVITLKRSITDANVGDAKKQQNNSITDTQTGDAKNQQPTSQQLEQALRRLNTGVTNGGQQPAEPSPTGDQQRNEFQSFLQTLRRDQRPH